MSNNQQGRICVAIGKKSVYEALEAAEKVASLADVIEIRLDNMVQPACAPLVKNIDVPLLFTLRPTWEGGFFEGDEEARIDVLVEAIELGATYIDLELLAPDSSHARIREALKSSSTQLIISNHNFNETPAAKELSELLVKIKAKQADIGKIITTTNDYKDVLRLLTLQLEAEQLGLPLISFGMGQQGVISRLTTLQLGGYMTYCAADGEEGTAPGQIGVKKLREIYDILSLN